MTSFATLRSSWAACFSLMKPSSIYQLLMASFLAMRDNYMAMAMQSWWMLPLFVFASLINLYCALGLLIFLVACSSRSSVDMKDHHYFIKKIPLLLVYLVVLGFLFGAGVWAKPLVGKAMLSLGHYLNMSPSVFSIVQEIILANVSILLLIMLFFLLDSGFWLRPLRNVPLNGLKMFIFNYPVFFFASIVTSLAITLSLTLIVMLFFVLGISLERNQIVVFDSIIAPILLLFIPFCIALVHTFYVRRAYDQSELYTYL